MWFLDVPIPRDWHRFPGKPLTRKSPRLRVYWRGHTAEDQSACAAARERSSVKCAAQPDAPPLKPILGKRFPVLCFSKGVSTAYIRGARETERRVLLLLSSTCEFLVCETGRRFVAITPVKDVDLGLVCIIQHL